MRGQIKCFGGARQRSMYTREADKRSVKLNNKYATSSARDKIKF